MLAEQQGEQLQLFRSDDEKDVPTGVRVRVQVRAVPESKDWDGISYLDLPDLACPHCNRPGTLVQSLVVGQTCPACHQDTIMMTGSCIYLTV